MRTRHREQKESLAPPEAYCTSDTAPTDSHGQVLEAGIDIHIAVTVGAGKIRWLPDRVLSINPTALRLYYRS